MKIAYCMSGCIGGLIGRAGDKNAGSELSLAIAAEAYDRYVYCNKTDTIDKFIFSWDTHLEEQYKTLYKPTAIQVKEQIIFDTKATNEYNRFQSAYSRWYSVKKVIELKNATQLINGKYDLVILSRLDLCWLKHINLSELVSSYINFDQAIFRGDLYGTKTSVEIGDRFIASTSENIDAIATLYDKLPEYCERVPMYRGISSHFLIPHHLKMLGLRDCVAFPFFYWTPSYNQSYESSHCTLVRTKK